jgi:hypothetical protein
MQFSGKTKTTINGGIGGPSPAENHADGHDTSGYSTAGATSPPDAEGKPGGKPDYRFRIAKPEPVIDGFDNGFRAVELTGAVILLISFPDLCRNGRHGRFPHTY